MDILQQIRKIEENIQLTYYLQYNSAFDITSITTSAHTFFQKKYWNRQDVDLIIPESKHHERYELLNTYYDTIKSDDIIDSDSWNFYKQKVIPVFNKIQSSGIYTKKSLQYTNYNIYTKTGRPSNSNNGINYAALNKTDGSRIQYTSRFKDGSLYEFDFDAYHLVLIANLINYEIPDENFHDHLAKIYFNTDTITEEQHTKSKSMSFQILYGTYETNTEIEYFKLINEYIYSVWDLFNIQGYIETPIANRKLFKANFPDLTPHKLFNYIIQAYETESNVLILENLIRIMEPLESKIILYTYDSFLFDIKKCDTYIVDIVRTELKYPHRCSNGINYNTMHIVD